MKIKQPLNQHLAIIFIFSLGVMTILQGVLSNWFIHSEIDNWQANKLEKSKNITINLIRNRFDGLTTLTLDYAIWDATYQFIEKAKGGEKAEFFRTKDLPTSNLVATLLIDSNNKVLSNSAVSGVINKENLARAFLASAVEGEDKGLIFYNDKIFQYVKKAVFETVDKAKTNGFLIFFREFGKSDIEDIINDVGTYFSLDIIKPSPIIKRYSLKQFSLPVLANLDKNDTELIGIYNYVLRNNEILPVQLSVRVNRNVDSVLRLDVMAALQVLSLLIIAGIMLYKLRTTVVLPIIRMANHLVNQNSNTDDYIPLNCGSDNELGYLADNIDKLFEQITEQNKFSQMLLDSNEDIILTIDEDLKISHANPSAQKWFTRTEEQLKGVDVNFALTSLDDTQHSLLYCIRQVMTSSKRCEMLLTLRNNFLQVCVNKVEVTCYQLNNDNAGYGKVLLIMRIH